MPEYVSTDALLTYWRSTLRELAANPNAETLATSRAAWAAYRRGQRADALRMGWANEETSSWLDALVDDFGNDDPDE